MKEDIRRLIETLDSKSSVAFAYLFGSKVKGFATDRSDWDIAIYFSEPLEEVGHWPAFELEAELSRAVGSTVQVIVLNILPPPILGFQIVSSSVVLIDRDENRRMDFENRTLRQYYDWQYFLKRQMNAGRRLFSI
jgi:hypothetical protein